MDNQKIKNKDVVALNIVEAFGLNAKKIGEIFDRVTDNFKQLEQKKIKDVELVKKHIRKLTKDGLPKEDYIAIGLVLATHLSLLDEISHKMQSK